LEIVELTQPFTLDSANDLDLDFHSVNIVLPTDQLSKQCKEDRTGVNLIIEIS